MKKRETVIITFLSIITLLLAVLVSTRLWARVDLTKNKTYTISRVSRNLSAELPSELRITYFVSDRLKTTYAIPGEIEDILKEYAARSRGKIRVSVKDPAKTGMEGIVEELGIEGRQMQVMEQNQTTFAVVYSGILIEYLNESSVIPFAVSVETLEYDLTSRIRALITGNERRIGILPCDAGKTVESNYGYLNEFLAGSGFKVSILSPGDDIPENLPALILIGGAESLEKPALYKIDRYIRMGGKALFAVDAMKILQAQGGVYPYAAEDKGLLEMLSSYGAVVEKSFALDVSNNIVQYSSGASLGGRSMYQLIQYPFYISVLPEYGNKLSPLTSTFSGVDVYWASPITLQNPTGIEGDVLFTTTEEGWLQTQDFNVNPGQSWAFTAERDATKGVKNLAVSLSGVFPAFFTEKPELEEGAPSLPDMPSSGKEARVIVIGDAELIENQYLEQTQSRRTLDFFMLCADYLSNDDDIIGIRSRSQSSQKLDRIVDETARNAAMNFARILGTIIMPLIVLALGVFVITGRRRRENARSEIVRTEEASNV